MSTIKVHQSEKSVSNQRGDGWRLKSYGSRVKAWIKVERGKKIDFKQQMSMDTLF